ncbi:MAG: hypothetical protein ACSHXY_02975 [Alphaproteobacteria bacterium]
MTSWNNGQTGSDVRPAGRLGPLANKIYYGGTIILFLICGVLAADLLRPDDSGFIPPFPQFAQNNAAETPPLDHSQIPAKAAATTQLLSVREMPSKSIEDSKAAATPSPQQSVAAYNFPKVENTVYEEIPFKQETLTSVPAAKPKPKTSSERKHVVEKTEDKKTVKKNTDVKTSETPSLPQQSISSPSVDPSSRDVMQFITKRAATGDTSKIQQYSRALSVLEQCGKPQKSAAKAYKKTNERIFKRLLEFENSRAAMDGSSPKGKLAHLEPTQTPYSSTPSESTCAAIAVKIKSGAFDITL